MAKIQLTSETRSLNRRKPGFALLKISGWMHSPEQTKMAIQRSEDEKFLGLDSQWEPQAVWQSLDNMTTADNYVLEGDVGPALVDPIVDSPNNSYRVTLKANEEEETRTMRVDGTLYSSKASGSAPSALALGKGFILDDFEEPIPVVEEPEVVVQEMVEPVVTEDIVDDTIEVINDGGQDPVTVDSKSTSSKKKVIVLIFLVLLLLSAVLVAAWYFKWFPFQDNSTIAPPSPTPVIVPSNLSDLELLQKFVATNPTADNILAKAKEWQQSGHCDATLRLMVYSGHKNSDSRIALEYAKWYDPNLFKAGGCVDKADKETAIYWYGKAVDSGNTEATSFLEKL